MLFRFEWFDNLDLHQHEYETPSGFRILEYERWVKAPRRFQLWRYYQEGLDEEMTGEDLLRLTREAPSNRFVVPYDEYGFVLLIPPKGYEIEEALPSNPPSWLGRIRGQLKSSSSKQTFWEKL